VPIPLWNVLLTLLKTFNRMTEIGHADVGADGEFVMRLKPSVPIVPGAKVGYDILIPENS
jgi:hypothetical protein